VTTQLSAFIADVSASTAIEPSRRQHILAYAQTLLAAPPTSCAPWRWAHQDKEEGDGYQQAGSADPR
jgi:hypothetical protein